MTFVNVALVIICAFSFVAEKEKEDYATMKKSSNILAIPDNYIEDSESYANSSLIFNDNSVRSMLLSYFTEDLHTSSNTPFHATNFNLDIDVSSNISLYFVQGTQPNNKLLPLFDGDIYSSSNMSYFLQPYDNFSAVLFIQHLPSSTDISSIFEQKTLPYANISLSFIQDIQSSATSSSQHIFPEVPTSTVTSSITTDNEASAKERLSSPTNGASAKVDRYVIYMYILLTIVMALLTGIVTTVAYFWRTNYLMLKEMTELKEYLRYAKHNLEEMKTNMIAVDNENQQLITKLSKEKQGREESLQTAIGLRFEYFKQEAMLTKRLDAIDRQFKSSERTLDEEVSKHTADIECLMEEFNVNKQTTDMASQTWGVPSTKGILVKGNKVRRYKKTVSFW